MEICAGGSEYSYWKEFETLLELQLHYTRYINLKLATYSALRIWKTQLSGKNTRASSSSGEGEPGVLSFKFSLGKEGPDMSGRSMPAVCEGMYTAPFSSVFITVVPMCECSTMQVKYSISNF